MTERERIEMNIKLFEYDIQKYRAYIENLDVRIAKQRDQLAALPLDKPDLSVWRPRFTEEYFFIREDGVVSPGPVEIGRWSGDYNHYQTRAEAERAAKRQKLHTRLWQIHHHPKMYGEEGWEPEAYQYAWEVCRRNGFDDAYPASTVSGSVTSAPFKTEQDAQWVIEELQSEGLL